MDTHDFRMFFLKKGKSQYEHRRFLYIFFVFFFWLLNLCRMPWNITINLPNYWICKHIERVLSDSCIFFQFIFDSISTFAHLSLRCLILYVSFFHRNHRWAAATVNEISIKNRNFSINVFWKINASHSTAIGHTVQVFSCVKMCFCWNAFFVW